MPRKTTMALATGAVGAYAYSRHLAQQETEAARKQQQALQWAIPGLTGAAIASSVLREKKPTPKQVLREGAHDARVRAAEVAGPLAAMVGARALSAAQAAGPALERARDSAGPAFERARDNAVPALERARDAAAPVVARAKEALPV